MEGDGLTNDQTEKVLQFQDLTGIEDINICRDVLIRHQWDLEVAIQEQLNIREGRPSMYAANDRAPQVINDRFLQHIFTNSRPDNSPTGLTATLRYFSV
ncbi:FAS-associated factor 2-B [Pseudolycoriella hygida]|uniref:FAS-associated factor 2-B n=1 Tax=Pseudolycoriella hygida TaxID=35572 RepID=A0A9Q0S890_9DIPT|nr:FAS-associated factor 2-B [Pseudolycoriella hygida]